MKTTLQYYISTFLMNVIFRIGLPLDRNYAYAMLDAFENIPLEIDRGKKGGVIVVPWGITDEGLEFAKQQREEAIKAAINFRKKEENKK